MKGKITWLNMKELREEILGRMEALDTSDCENSDEDLIKDFEEVLKNNVERDYWKGKCKKQFAHALCFRYKRHKGKHKSLTGDCEWK